MSYDDNDIDTHVLPDLRAPRGSIFPYVCLVRKDSHKVERFVGSVTPARLITFVHEYMEVRPACRVCARLCAFVRCAPLCLRCNNKV